MSRLFIPAIAIAAAVVALPFHALAQRVTVSRPWTPIDDQWMTVIIPRKGAPLPPEIARRVSDGRLFERVIGFRGDSLLINAPPDSLNWGYRADAAFQPGAPQRILTIPAASIEKVNVRYWSEKVARRATGDECGSYLAFLGAALGAGGGALVAGKKGAGWGVAIGAVGAYAAGYHDCAKTPYHDYGWVWKTLTIGVAPGEPCERTCGP